MRTDAELYHSAVKRYAKDCDSFGAIYDEPNPWLCSVTRHAGSASVTLANTDRKLAIYLFKGPQLRLCRSTRES
jgi:hypothetical protein